MRGGASKVVRYRGALKKTLFFSLNACAFNFCASVLLWGGQTQQKNKTNKKALGPRVRSHVRAFLKAWQFLSRSLPSFQKPQPAPSERRQAPALALCASGQSRSAVRGLQARLTRSRLTPNLWRACPHRFSLVFLFLQWRGRVRPADLSNKKNLVLAGRAEGGLPPYVPPWPHNSFQKLQKKNDSAHFLRALSLCLCECKKQALVRLFFRYRGSIN